MREVYGDAKKRAEEAVRKANREGRSPYLPVLDEIVRQVDIKNEVSLGLLELPLSRIVGNKEKGRNNAFACNFMPLFEDGTEFAMKWSNLYDSVVQEGVREAIKVYEYMNNYYVQEGNKRVSVSHYCGSEYLTCDVTRLIPVESDTKEYDQLDSYGLHKGFSCKNKKTRGKTLFPHHRPGRGGTRRRPRRKAEQSGRFL